MIDNTIPSEGSTHSTCSAHSADSTHSVYIVAHSQVTKTFINWAIFKRKDSEGDDKFLT